LHPVQVNCDLSQFAGIVIQVDCDSSQIAVTSVQADCDLSQIVWQITNRLIVSGSYECQLL